MDEKTLSEIEARAANLAETTTFDPAEIELSCLVRQDVPALCAALREAWAEIEVGRLFASLPVGVIIKHTFLLGWSMEIYNEVSGNWYYNGCFDDPLEMLRDYHADPRPKVKQEQPQTQTQAQEGGQHE